MAGKKRILIADDEEGIRESLNLILGDTYELSYSVDGEETVAKARRGGFDAILLDIKMPKLDGLEVLKQMRKAGVTAPVLMLTAYQSVELAKESVRLGANNYLPKPFEREQILKAVEDAIKQ